MYFFFYEAQLLFMLDGTEEVVLSEKLVLSASTNKKQYILKSRSLFFFSYFKVSCWKYRRCLEPKKTKSCLTNRLCSLCAKFFKNSLYVDYVIKKYVYI